MSIVSAELIHRRAWPQHHHFSVSSGAAEFLFILVENTGTVTLYVRPLFDILRPDGTTIRLFDLNAVSTFFPGDEGTAGVQFIPTMFGTHHVTAEAVFGPDPNTLNGSNRKSFKFDVVP